MKAKIAGIILMTMLVLVAVPTNLMSFGTADGVESQLTPGVGQSGSLSGAGASDKYYITIEDGYDSLTVQTYNAGTGYDFDLYVRYQYYPTTSTYDVKGYTSSSNEICTIDSPAGGAYGIMVYSYSGSGSYSIKATLTGGSSSTTLTLGTGLTGQSLAGTGAEKVYSVDLDQSYDSLKVQTYDTTSGYDFDLYVKYNSVPTTSNYDVRGYTSSSSETCTISSPSTGTYYIMVHSYSGGGGFSVKASATGGGDTTPPVISSISATSITPSGATISWVTDEPSSTLVEYGTTTGYGSTATGSNGVTSHSVTLSGLSSDTTYHYRVKSQDSSTNLATSSDRSFSTEPVGDTTPPVISSISTSSISSSGATVTWSTNEYSTSVVEYGKTTSYGYTASGSSGTSHSVALSGLDSSTTYHYRVKSTDSASNTATSSDKTFATQSSSTGITELQSGVYQSASLSGQGDKKYYKIYLAESYDSLETITYDTTTGYDFDLYVKFGDLPTTSSYDGRGYTNSATETVTINNPSTGWYYVMVNSYSGSGSYKVKSTYSAPQGDTTPPVLSSIGASGITTSGATITWSTDEASSSVVEYGTTTGYGATATGSSSVTSHSVTLSSLAAGTTYHYRVKSTDDSSNTATSSDKTFTTTANPSGPTALTLDGSGVSDSLSATGQKEYYTVSVPTGKATLTVQTYDTSSGYDFDLYVRYGANPTTSTYDSRGYTSSSSETCTINNPTAGTYYIMVYSYSGSGSYKVKATSTESGGGGGGDKIALCIGISDYRSINDLSYCDEDAEDWTNYLQGKGYSVTTLIDSQATEAAIYSAIDNIVANADADTEVAITFSGHGGFQSEGGYSSSAGNTYGGQTDGHPSQFFAWDADSYGDGCILDNVLAYHLSSLASDHVLIFFDSCRSGGMDEVAITNRYVSQTCEWDEYGYDAPSYYNGCWTYWFLDWGLKTQGYTSFESCYAAAYPKANGDHYDMHPEEEDNYPGSFMV